MNDAIEDSTSISRCIQEIKAQGFDLSVFLEATVYLSHKDETPVHQYKKQVSSRSSRKPKRLRLNHNDRACLDSLKISYGRTHRDPAS